MIAVAISVAAIALSFATVYFSVKTNRIIRDWARLNDLRDRDVCIDEKGNEVKR